ncbi:hypothetical protein DASB73_027860 [Starmerella bacillaris]|uniref:Uncharacterized protein n=1 Tax=Starmerella bacillaris TaxID=1247836 RepID=A0AAV5RM43_STABA|nr:hypothetical protein DASB73_027860 [Starmerella bacillaris]
MSVDHEDEYLDLTHALEAFNRQMNETGLSDCSDDDTEAENNGKSADWESIGLLPSWEKFQVVFQNAQYHFMAGLRRPGLSESEGAENEADLKDEDLNDSYCNPADLKSLQISKNDTESDDEYEDPSNDEDEEEWEQIGRLPTLNQLQYTLKNASSMFSTNSKESGYAIPLPKMMSPSDIFAKYKNQSSSNLWQNITQNLQFTSLLGEDVHESPIPETDEFKALCSEEGITEEEKLISFNEQGMTGCPHYYRNCKSACSVCNKFYMCQVCHDDNEMHEMDRTKTTRMLCLNCKKPQPAARECYFCKEIMGDYYCSKCKLWSDDPDKPIYHCDKCGICRVGRGIGIDVFHCDKCGICMSLVVENMHKCIERAANSGCPICLDDLFSSTKPVVFMPCGHPIHSECFNEYSKRFYRCPLCSKSILNTSALFRMIDEEVRSEVLPPELENQDVYIVCQDCRLKSRTKFHLAGLKCDTCGSYNTFKL